jgi:hypothetical protein
MFSQIRLNDVFTPGGLPSVTYVGRDHLELEKSVADGLARGFAFVVVTGPTKSGKSVLCRKILRDENIVSIEGGQVRSENDFWAHVAYRLRIGAGSSHSRADTSTTSIAGEASGGIVGVVQGKGGLTQTDARQRTSTINYDSVPMLACIDRLLETKATLMIDDFHYIDPALQRTLIQSLKGAVFKGLPVLFLAVPHRAFDPVMVESEVEGRLKHVSIPSWALDDLVLIPEKGFHALNVSLDREIQRQICNDSFGNPLLVQEVCSELCLQNGIKSARRWRFKLDGKLLKSTYRALAESKGFPVYQRLKRGPDGRKTRKPRKLRLGGQIDLYEAVLASIARLGPKSTTSFEEIRSSLRELLGDDKPALSRAELTNCLSNMSEMAKKMEGEPPLEWIPADQRLEIIDPFLLFCLKWSAH